MSRLTSKLAGPWLSALAACGLLLIAGPVHGQQNATIFPWHAANRSTSQLPSASRFAPYVPAAVSQPVTPAYIQVHVPPLAKVFFDNTPTQQTGPERQFASPPINAQQSYSYAISVSWSAHGQEKTLSRTVHLIPGTVRQFFALVNQHMRWELNDMARRLDEEPAAVELRDGLMVAPASSDLGLTPDGRRMLEAIGNLPECEREAFDLVRIQGMTQAEAAKVLGVSAMTVNRRLNRSLQLLTETLRDLCPDGQLPGSS